MTLLHDAKYCGTYVSLEELPQTLMPEIAFLGRSNVGKSSAINVLLQRKALAYVSKTPGCTRWINFYELSAMGINLVDLPGYGFSRVSGDVQKKWEGLLAKYLHIRENLKGVCVLCDIRRGLTDLDSTLLAWISPRYLPVHILLTKSDKLSYSQCKISMQAVKAQLAVEYPIATVQLFSSLKGTGGVETWQVVSSWLQDKGIQEEVEK